jgi:hypothetical protein
MRFALALALAALALALAALAGVQATAAAAQGEPAYYCDPLHVYYPAVARCPVPWRAVGPAAPALQPYAAPAPGGQAPIPASPQAGRPTVPTLGDGLDDLCAKVKLPSSIAICSDRELRALSIERGHAFDEAKDRLTPDQQKALLADQYISVPSYSRECGVADALPALPLAPKIKECMVRAGRARIAYLRGYGVSGAAANPTTTPAANAIGANGSVYQCRNPKTNFDYMRPRPCAAGNNTLAVRPTAAKVAPGGNAESSLDDDLNISCAKFLASGNGSLPLGPAFDYVTSVMVGNGFCCGVDVANLLLAECRIHERLNVAQIIGQMIDDYKGNRLPPLPQSHNQGNDPRIDADFKAFNAWVFGNGPMPTSYTYDTTPVANPLAANSSAPVTDNPDLANTPRNCSSDWHQCADNSDLVNHYNNWHSVKIECMTAVDLHIQYGSPKWPRYMDPFSTFEKGTDYVTRGIAILIEPDAQLQNMYGAMVHSEVVCTYDLRAGHVLNVVASPAGLLRLSE